MQENGCGAVFQLVDSHAGRQTNIARAGSIEAAVKTMQTLAQRKDVQKDGGAVHARFEF